MFELFKKQNKPVTQISSKIEDEKLKKCLSALKNLLHKYTVNFDTSVEGKIVLRVSEGKIFPIKFRHIDVINTLQSNYGFIATQEPQLEYDKLLPSLVSAISFSISVDTLNAVIESNKKPLENPQEQSEEASVERLVV